MVVRLSNVCSKTKCIFCVLGCFESYYDLPIAEAEVARVIAAVLADSDMVLHFFVGPIVIGVGASMSKFLSWHAAAADLPGLAEEQ